jgi:hypothetical protein
MTMGLFLIIIYFQGALIFHKYIYNIVDKNLGGGGGGGNIHPMMTFS